jgi:hypothetical protein
MTMPLFELEQYEICVTKYRVEASSEAEAIAKLFDGGAEAVDDCHEYIEIAEDCGLPADEHQELVEGDSECQSMKSFRRSVPSSRSNEKPRRDVVKFLLRTSNSLQKLQSRNSE